jgi:hypothetical protein
MYHLFPQDILSYRNYGHIWIWDSSVCWNYQRNDRKRRIQVGPSYTLYEQDLSEFLLYSISAIFDLLRAATYNQIKGEKADGDLADGYVSTAQNAIQTY